MNKDERLKFKALINSKVARMHALEAEYHGMVVTNEQRREQDHALAYDEGGFFNIARSYRAIANELLKMATQEV